MISFNLLFADMRRKLIPLALSLAAMGGVHAQSAKLMIDGPKPDVTQMSSKAQSELHRVQNDPFSTAVTVTHLDGRAFYSNVISVTVDGRVLTFVKQGPTETAPDGSTIWIGKGDNYATALFSINGTQITGNIRTMQGVYQITPLEGDAHAITLLHMPKIKDENEHKDERKPEPAAASTPAKVSYTEAESRLMALAPSAAAPAAVANPPVRLLIAYTSRALAVYGSVAALQQQVNIAISGITSANQFNGVAFRPQQAGALLPVTYTGPADATSSLNAFTTMTNVMSAHDSQGADLMIMLDDLTASGEAGASYAINATAANAYAVVAVRYMASYLSLAHEVGHLMGADHPQPDTAQNVFRFGHGYWWWNQISLASEVSYCAHTIMSYYISQSNNVGLTSVGKPPACENDPRMDNWSSPSAYVGGIPGVAGYVIMGATNANDNAQVLSITGPVVTNFHLTMLTPPPRTGNPKPPNCSVNPRACA